MRIGSVGHQQNMKNYVWIRNRCATIFLLYKELVKDRKPSDPGFINTKIKSDLLGT